MLDPVNHAIALCVGALAGLHTSTWGMYKDAIYEGFTYPRYFRSTVVAAVLGVLALPVARLDLYQPGQIVVYFGLIYVLERGVTEFWKTFVRTEDQSKYFIPMQFHVLGKVITSRGRRLVIGIPFALAVCGIFLAVHALDVYGLLGHSWLAVFLVASTGGWISAFGGAWKDAPIEGFEPLKFVRSPLTTALASSFAQFTTSYLLITLAALGYERATLETYKTFFFPNKPRGKFAGKPIQFPEMIERRKRFVPVYAAIWLALLTSWALAFASPHAGLVSLP